jgi:hypothetical protein
MLAEWHISSHSQGHVCLLAPTFHLPPRTLAAEVGLAVGRQQQVQGLAGARAAIPRAYSTTLLAAFGGSKRAGVKWKSRAAATPCLCTADSAHGSADDSLPSPSAEAAFHGGSSGGGSANGSGNGMTRSSRDALAGYVQAPWWGSRQLREGQARARDTA